MRTDRGGRGLHSTVRSVPLKEKAGALKSVTQETFVVDTVLGLTSLFPIDNFHLNHVVLPVELTPLPSLWLELPRKPILAQ